MYLSGFRVVLDKYLPKEFKWIFPKDRFVEWRKEDESYCRWAGYGHEVELPVIWVVGDMYVVNEVAYKEIQKLKEVSFPRIPLPGSILNWAV